MRLLMIGILAPLVLLFSAGAGEAREHKWCLFKSGGLRTCRFDTWEQCFASRTGNSDFCRQNARYQSGAPAGQNTRNRPRRAVR